MPDKNGDAGGDEIKLWKGVLLHLARKPAGTEFTAGDLVEDLPEAVGTYAAAAQLLKRLQTWGLIRVSGFAPAVRATPNPKKKNRRGAAGGRQRKVYEVTDHGRKKATWIESEAS